MKIFYIDPNNNTAQVNYPFVEYFQKNLPGKILFYTTYNRFGSKYYDKFFNIRVKYFFFKAANKIKSRSLRRIFKLITFPYFCLKLFGEIYKEKPDIIHLNWINLPLVDYFFIISCQIFFNLPILLTQHNFFQHNKKKLRLFENKILSTADYVICLSDFIAKKVRKFNKNVVKINHGNCYEKEIDFYSNEITAKDSDYFTVLFTGIIKPYKGVDLLIEAMNVIENTLKVDQIKLKIVGYCEKIYEQKLRELISKYDLQNVEFENGFVSNKRLFQYISNSGVGVLPYKRASQSGLPYIYYYLHRPVVVTRVGGLAEQVNEDVGLECDTNPESIAETLIQVKQKSDQGNYTPKHFNEFLKKNKWEIIMQEYYSLYRSVLED